MGLGWLFDLDNDDDNNCDDDDDDNDVFRICCGFLRVKEIVD